MQFQTKFSRIQAIGLLYPLPFTLSFESHCSSFLTFYRKFGSFKFLLTSGSITTMTGPDPSERERSASHACVVRVQQRDEGEADSLLQEEYGLDLVRTPIRSYVRTKTSQLTTHTSVRRTTLSSKAPNAFMLDDSYRKKKIGFLVTNPFGFLESWKSLLTIDKETRARARTHQPAM